MLAWFEIICSISLGWNEGYNPRSSTDVIFSKKLVSKSALTNRKNYQPSNDPFYQKVKHIMCYTKILISNGTY